VPPLLAPTLRSLVLVAVALGPPAAAGDLTPAARADLRWVERWVERFEERGDPYWADTRDELAETLDRLVGVADADESAARRVALALFDLTGARLESSTRRSEPAPAAQAVHGLADLRLHTLYDRSPELLRWLGPSVLASSRHSSRRRSGAARSLDGLREPGTMRALFAAASSADARLRHAAIATLLGWPHERVHAFLARQLGRWTRERDWIDPEPIVATLGEAYLRPGGAAAREVARSLARGLEARDWRTCARTLRFVPAFPDAVVVPTVLEALDEWTARAEAGAGSRRIVGDLAAELQRRSGRRIGPFPDRWRLWWTAVREGRIERASERPAAVTRATFFGLRPETDRVAFLVDRSGSMDAAHSGAADGTRYEEAGRQLLELLRSLGPATRFRIVLFDDRLRTWRSDLVPATERNLDAAGRFLRAHGPRGGTELRPAVREVLRLDDGGRPDLAELEIDTVIVLCDGHTQDGPGWVDPLLDDVADETAIRFHGVQIGGAGDGTLRRLASRTGGEFRVVSE